MDASHGRSAVAGDSPDTEITHQLLQARECLERADMPEIDKIAFESKHPDRGFTVRASYLKAPDAGDALIEIFHDGKPVRDFRWPAYKVWNIAAHFSDIVDGELANNDGGY